jgi:phytoene dehydrogenase-like protein
MAETAEIAPGVRAPVLADTVGRLRPSVARDLRLREHGLSLVQPAVRVFAPRLDGRHVTLWGDVAHTAEELAANDSVGAEDARSYPEADARLRSLASALAVLMSSTPPDLTHSSIGDAVEGLKIALRTGARTRSGPEPANAGGLLRVLPMAVNDLLSEWFQSDALRAVIAARAIRYTGLAPRIPGTAQVLLTDSAGHDGGLAGQAVLARGGPGALASALVAAARGFGAEVRTDADVVHVRHDGDRVRGVVLAGGEEIDAPFVASGLDPRKTLLELLAPEAIGPRLSWRAANIRGTGATAKVNLALGDLPAFPGLDADEADRRLRGRIVIAPDLDYLERAADAAKYGRIAEEPYLEATIPTLIDPSLVDRAAAGPVRHVMSVIVQAAPYRLRDQTWDECRGALGETVLRTLERYAPGIRDQVEAQQVITPLDLERDYGVNEGHPMHAEVALDQWFAWRPMHGLARYRLPLDGMYLCGSGAHPGGGVTGGPGQLAAREILGDAEAAGFV